MTIKKGSLVKVHYTGTLSNHEVFDSSIGKEPLEFELGKNQVIKGFEDAVLNMNLNETKTFTVAAIDAYGEISQDLIVEVPRSNLPADIIPEIGMELELKSENQIIPVSIYEINENTIKINANHKLAGEDLTFNINIVAIN